MEELEKKDQDKNEEPEDLRSKSKKRKIVRHDPTVPKHDFRVPKNNIEMEREDGQARRDTPHQDNN